MAGPLLDTMDVAEERPLAAPLTTARSTAQPAGLRAPAWVGWAFVAPALLVYAFFVLWPLLLTFQCSLFSWDGVGPSTWVGLDNYSKVFTDPELSATIVHAFKLI